MKNVIEYLSNSTEEPLYEMSNLWQARTGLDEIIWVSGKNANHGARIKVYKNKVPRGPNFSVTISDNPKTIGDVFVSNKELLRIYEFVKLNKELLLQYWEYQIETYEMVNSIKKVGDDTSTAVNTF